MKKKKALPFSLESAVEMLRALSAASKSCTCFNNRSPLSGSNWMFTVANVLCKKERNQNLNVITKLSPNTEQTGQKSKKNYSYSILIFILILFCNLQKLSSAIQCN